MRLTVIGVGRVKQRELRGAIDEYLARLRRYLPCEEIEIADGTAGVVAEAIERVAQRSSARLIALDVTGRALSSEAFASQLERSFSTGKGHVAFAIGGADGLPPATLTAAVDRWSLSPLTFPHRLARLVLVEQLYRAMTILRREPYAH
jgi:23S rRNA (pseudouridine1915-N3)-methyltransferase